jgi:hypothetical protein
MEDERKEEFKEENINMGNTKNGERRKDVRMGDIGMKIKKENLEGG